MSQSLFDLSGAKALVTGAARGIGRTMAEGFAAAGADVVIADIDIEPAAEAKEAIEGMGRKCALIQTDVTDMESAERMVVEAAAAFGGLTILVNNAGTNVRKTLWDISEADWDRILDLNLKSIFFITRRAGEEMKKAGGGKVINISSLMGWSVFRNPRQQCYGPYTSSKSGLIGLTRVFAREYATDNIQVNAICPTFIETPLSRTMLEDPGFRSFVTERIATGTVGRPEDVMGAVVYLASDASALVTGSALMIDGGWTAV